LGYISSQFSCDGFDAPNGSLLVRVFGSGTSSAKLVKELTEVEFVSGV
jgi:hypothetical protein